MKEVLPPPTGRQAGGNLLFPRPTSPPAPVAMRLRILGRRFFFPPPRRRAVSLRFLLLVTLCAIPSLAEKAVAVSGAAPYRGVSAVAQADGLPPQAEIGAILSAAESLFAALRRHDAPAVFALLSERSRATIVEETLSALRKAGTRSAEGTKDVPPPSRDEIAADFARGGPLSRAYWKGFSRKFDPDEALERSRWEIGRIDSDRAVVAITHTDSGRAAVVRMFREGGSWKVGLVETFWTR